MRLATRFVLIVVGILSVTLAINTYFFLRSQGMTLEQQLTERGRVVGHLIALISPEAILAFDFLTLNEYAREVSLLRDVVYGVIVDNDGKPLTSFVNGSDQHNRASLDGLEAGSNSVDPRALQTLLQRLADHPDVIPMDFPIIYEDRTLAHLRVGISRAELKAQADEQLVQQFAIYAIIIAFLSTAIYLVFRCSVMRRLEQLIEASRHIGRGEFKQVRVSSRDELGQLAEAFNAMATAIADEQAKLHYQANYDALTAQPNRHLAIERLKQEIRSAHRHRHRFALMFIDLNDFKVVNDTLGHATGDLLLKLVSGRLRTQLREEDTLARLGGDEFLVLLPRTGDAAKVKDVADRLLAATSEPTLLSGREVVVHSSIGIALYPDDGETVESLMANADNAMYQAKRHGRSSICFFTQQMNAQVRERLQLEQDLNKVLARNELYAVYQPICRCADGAYAGAEVLLRWEHPERGPINPAMFIPLAESTGQIVDIGNWVLCRAARQLRRWLDQGLAPGHLAVNLSRVQLLEGLEQTLDQILRDHDLPPRMLELEITENVLLDDHYQVADVLARLRAMGISFSLDDFGTGYSSLSYLRRFSFDTLKIDRSFIAPLCDDPEAAVLVRTIIAMAHSLSLAVVAEGVETHTQLELLRELDCDYVQGYLISPPLCEDEFAELLVRLAGGTKAAAAIQVSRNG
ncbi:MAG TPA: EAL domain-containing protein [Rhodocyclaceae bacterium]|nr:EAL domain-containing protein [Rhodocyclaceae bacterium]